MARIALVGAAAVRAVRPDADVVGFQGQPDPVAQPECADELARQLQPPGPVQHRVLLRHLGLLPVLIGVRPAEDFGADPPVPDRDRPADVLGHHVVMGDDQYCDAQLLRWPCCSAANTPAAVSPSSSPVGSSASRTRGLVGQRHADGYPLLLAAGQLAQLS